MPRTPIVERAYQLADHAAACRTLRHISETLIDEGYSGAEVLHVQGGAIRGDLRVRIALREVCH